MRLVRGLVAALSLAFLGALAGPAFAAPAMWVVRDADSEVYLFGSMHMLKNGAKWRTRAFDAVYERADAVWFEADVDADPLLVRDLIARYGVDPQRPLTGKLSPEGVRRLKPILNRERIAIEAVDPLRPWAAAMMLSVRPMMSRGYAIEHGADAVVTRAAGRAEKPVRTFETFEEQVRFFADLPEAVEVQYLEDILARQGGAAASGPTLMQAWMAGDLDHLAQTVVDDMRATRPALYDAMLKRRNEAWARTLAGEMAGSGVQLVNVGALHMIGADGLPALLKAQGFAVERVQ